MTSAPFRIVEARAFRAGVILAMLALASACAPEAGPTGPTMAPSFSMGGGSTAGELLLCKVTFEPTTAEFDFEVDATAGRVPGNGSFTLSARQDASPGPECEVVWRGDSDATVTITEFPPLGWSLLGVVYDQTGFIEPVDNSVSISVDAAVGGVVYFKNEPAPIDMDPGRMTGGGGQWGVGDLHVTRGFTIHCDITLSNNIEVNWTGGNHWHLDKPITSATCIDDPAIAPEPPPAPFDTFIGEGVGKLNGVDGSVIRFTFVDAGEPSGRGDWASIDIWAPGDDPDTDVPVLSIAGDLDHGNIQAHYDQPHK